MTTTVASDSGSLDAVDRLRNNALRTDFNSTFFKLNSGVTDELERYTT
jgi:hypothetical protein